jgi:hypothetical protein
VVYIASTTTMDYVWALAFVLAALYFALGRRPVVAGVLLGAAISCRITSGAMIVPLGIILAMSGERRWDVRASLMFVVTTLVVGGLLFSPVLYRYHFDFFTHYGATPRWHKVPRLATDRVWGRLGWVAVAAGSVIALWLAVRRRDRTWSALPRRTQASLGACLVAIVLYVVAFLKLPVEAGYLIPVVPFVLFPLARLLPRPVLAAICVALLISPFMAVGRHGFARGEVLVERTKRCAEMEVVQSYCHTVNRLEPKSVTIVGYQFHWVEGMGLATDAQRRYVYSLGPVEAATYRAQGYRLYYTPPGRAEVLGGGGDVDRYGAWPLPGTEEGSDRRRL